MVISAGTLRNAVTIQRAVTLKNEFGEPEESWTNLYSTQAAFAGIKGREFFGAQQVSDEITIPVVVRYRQQIKPTDRILFGSRIFQVLSVVNVGERDRKVMLNCKELNAS